MLLKSSHALSVCLVLVLLALVYSSTRAEGPAGDVLKRWSFDKPGDLAGWRIGRGIAHLRIEAGKLVGTTTHPDAYIFAPRVDVPMDGLIVRVRWSSPTGSTGQCYFTTDRSPEMGEDKVVAKLVDGGAMTVTDFSLGAVRHRGSKLSTFRLDPFNGQENAPFEIDEVILLSVPPRLEVTLAPSKPVAEPGEKIAFHIRVRHLEGRLPEGKLKVELSHSESRAVVREIDLGVAAPQSSMTLSFTKRGAHVVHARVQHRAQRTHDLECTVLVGLAKKPGTLALDDGHLGVELIDDAFEVGSVRAARIWCRHDGGWHEAALLLPLVEVVTDEGGVVTQRQPALRDEKTGREAITLASTAPWRAAVNLAISPERQSEARKRLAIRSDLRGPRAGRLLRFAGPAVRRRASSATLLDRHGLFGGIEFLEPGWRSSSDRAVGPKYAERWTPHPFKVCLPVMAIEQQGVTTAVLWNPHQEWAPGRIMPMATFASPNFLEGGADHLMQLSVPSIREHVRENERLARRAFEIESNLLQLNMLVEVTRKPVLSAARSWYELHGIPEAPPWTHDDRKLHDLIARCYGETVYWPEEKGWRAHWFLDQKSWYQPHVAAELLLHARTTGNQRWVRATGVDTSRTVAQTAGHLWNMAHGSGRAAAGARGRMRADGTFPFRNSATMRERTREHSRGKFDTLGEDGSTSLGTCVQGALPLIRHYFLSGRQEFHEPVVRALEAMRRFRVPRGAQVWEVHQQIPDIRAAALAVDAYRMGYLATGDEKYLEDAFYWADAGLPFLFSWRPPLDAAGTVVRTSRNRDEVSERAGLPTGELFEKPLRQVNPYGTIPVLGTTFYVISWFGVLVQWCGLEWAWHVNELLEIRDDPVLRATADGVLRSGLQQMFDRQPWTGLYPDVWNLLDNWAGGALIAPRFIINALRSSGHLPQELRVWTRRVGEGSTARLVHGRGKVTSIAGDRSAIRLELAFLEKEEAEIIVARSTKPRRVTVNGIQLEEGNGIGQWRYDPNLKLFGLRFMTTGPVSRVEVGWR